MYSDELENEGRKLGNIILRIPEIHKFKYCFAGQWIVHVTRFLDYPWFINNCCDFSLLIIIKCLLYVYYNEGSGL